MIELTPEQEAAALAALEAKEARTKAQVIAVKPGAIERNSSASTQDSSPESEKNETIADKLGGNETVGFLQRLKNLMRNW